MLHDNVDFKIFLVDDSVVIPHNIRVSEFSQNVDLWNDLLLLFFVHFAVIKLLPHKELAVRFPLYFAYKTKTAYSSLA